MSQSEPYEAVLRELRSQRDNIDAAIKAMEKVREFFPRASNSVSPDVGVSSAPSLVAPSADALSDVQVSDLSRLEDSVSYAGLTIYEAAIMALRGHGEAMPNIELTDAIQRGGLKMNSLDNYNTVSSVLTRRFYEHGDVVRVGRGIWGLPEWYPDRDYRAEAIAKRDKKAEAVKASSIDPSKINAGSISAKSIAAGSISTGIIDGSLIAKPIDPNRIAANMLNLKTGAPVLTFAELLTKTPRS